MTRPVFLADPAELASAAVGAEVHLGGPEAHHAATVRRLRTGEEVDLVDGAGRRVTGTVAAVAKDRLAVSVTAVLDEPAPTPQLVLVQALAKGGRDEQAVESATELGVDRVVPWQADRCVSRWDAKAAKGRARWASVAEGAAKQSRRAFVPAVDDVVTTSSLAAAVSRASADGAVVLVLHESATERLAALLGKGERGAGVAPPGEGAPTATPREPAPQTHVVPDRIPREPAPQTHDVPARIPREPAPQGLAGAAAVWCVVGPEGGISDDETDRLVAAGARLVRLGPHVLRTSSAGPAAIAALGVRLGRW
ncbi:16S rRNA (uracil(1498)-N(3))-methyltransferase [Georgenia sp. Z1344]|uniref:16S rRNA (uracil(1498)-N(3))-methyltransferase n=1 Tax=Georgenia sp. Z1344 TaxID=3416706 RepID=UPI003CEF82B0